MGAAGEVVRVALEPRAPLPRRRGEGVDGGARESDVEVRGNPLLLGTETSDDGLHDMK